MGDWDLVRKIMEEEGDLHFWRVKLRPGSPPLFGLWNNTPIFGLPGNPVSSHVVFRMLVAPWIRHNTQANGPIENRAYATLATKVKSTVDLTLWLRTMKLRKATITWATRKDELELTFKYIHRVIERSHQITILIESLRFLIKIVEFGEQMCLKRSSHENLSVHKCFF